MIEFNVSDRLKKIAALITVGNRVADIGTDHGYLPIYLVKENISLRVIAADLREKPLERAKKNARDFNVSEKIDFRFSDGFDKINAGEVDTAVICGMGGFAIIKILERALSENKVNNGFECVLSPHTDREQLSGFLYKKGFRITDEIMLHEKKAYYILWRCVYDGFPRTCDRATTAYGELLIERKDPALKEFLIREEELLRRVEKRLTESGSGNGGERLAQVRERLKLNYSVRWF